MDTPLTGLVGRAAKALDRALELRTAGDLLRHYPRRYSERGELTDLADVRTGDEVTVVAEISKVRRRSLRNRRSLLEVVVGDGWRTLTVTFFNQPWRERDLVVGRRGMFAGKVTEFRGTRQLNSPDYLLLGDGDEDTAKEFAGALIPVYPSASGLPSWVISRCVRTVLDVLEPPADPLPAHLRARHKLIDFATALREKHLPADKAALAAANKRLKWDEAMTVQVTLAQRRRERAARPGTPRPPRDDGALVAFDQRLPFTLTEGQRDVGATIGAELAGAHPMHRLLQGEVGSGKTVVALRGMLQVVDAGGQAALLAPTEVLAAQHARSLRELLGPLGRAGELDADPDAVRLTLLTGSLGARDRRTALTDAASGRAGIVVGTHALIQEGVSFADLGLVVVDEQHRFGVEQRDALRAKADRPPHVLVMTATPIPRTVAMTVFGDLETVSLRELPRGRSPISTTVVPATEKPHWLDRAWGRLREEVEAGHQAYVVCPRIGDDEPADTPAGQRQPLAVLDVAPMLTDGPLAGLRVGVLHGRLPADEKDAVMRGFADGELDVLVATTVIEVGVDVPNATAMVIMDADRFGISQSHQLRGRVGRGSAPGICLLVTDAPAGPARDRLDGVAATLDGFELARLDLEQRREGDVLGAAQSGRRSALRLLSLLRDEDLIAEARREATALVDADPDLAGHPELAAAAAALIDPDHAEYLEKA